MKTSSEYRALAWKELRTKFGPSSIIVGATLALGLIALLAFLLPLMFLSDQSPLVIGCIMLVMLLILYCTLGLLNYYLPVWYLSLTSANRSNIAGTKCSYGRAMAVVLLTTVPTFIPSCFSALIEQVDKAYVWILLALILAAYCFIFWWIYSVNNILPYIVHEHKELSVWQALKRSIVMMKGYKWKLFKVDIRIVFWPFLILFALAMTCGFMLGYARSGGSISTTTMIVTITGGIILFFATFFIIIPMFYFAHAHFYGDLRDEQSNTNNSKDCIN